MKMIKDKGNEAFFTLFFRKACIAIVWITVLYSQIIQYKFFMVSNGMLILGVFILTTYILAHTGEPFSVNGMIPKESIWMLAFMIYMLPLGWITSPNTSGHITQWIMIVEYLFVMIIISSLIMYSDTKSFHLLLLITAFSIIVLLLSNPVSYNGTERYSISAEVNPNGLGMAFTAGIWSTVYFTQKRKIPLPIMAGIVTLFCYGIIKTGSRKALIAAGIILFLWVATCYIPQLVKSQSPWKPIVLFASILVLIMVVVAFISYYSGSDMAARMDGLDSETKRASMYSSGWKLFKQSPLFGMGFQSFEYYFGIYSHATIVEVPVSAGICGSIIYFATYYISLKRSISLYKYSKKNSMIEAKEEIKLLLILWMAMLFYCTCIIHPYQFDSFIVFGIIFGETAAIEKKLLQQADSFSNKDQIWKRQCKYIR